MLHVGPMDATGAHFITVKAVDAGGKIVFAHAVIDVVGAPTSAEIPPVAAAKEPAILEAHPNPVHTTTTFITELSEPALVTLAVYDLLGREIEIVVSEYFPAGRFHRTWTPPDLASGTYFYRLSAGAYAEARLLTVRR